MRIFTSESVTEGHPDKVADYISDSVVDAHVAVDPDSRVACETLCKGGDVIVAGEITSRSTADLEAVVRKAIRDVGYTDPAEPFNADGVRIQTLLTQQAPEIAQGVWQEGRDRMDLGAGDQGMMFGYATMETPELMPLPILLAHRLTRTLAEHRRAGTPSWLRPDGKSQVSVEYEDGAPVAITDVLVSTQHSRAARLEDVEAYVREVLAPEALGDWFRPGITFHVNPTGSFVEGGPSADCGLTGRKLVVDSYGGAARIGGGAFSGKDASKVDRSGAYFGRWVARRILQEGLARRAEVQVAYAIGKAKPMSVAVETFGTGDPLRAQKFVESLDFRPRAIIERFGLTRPLFRTTTNYGHFGRPGLPWEDESVEEAQVA